MTAEQAFERYCKARWIEPEDWETEEEFEFFKHQTTDILRTFINAPVREGYAYAYELGWSDKHIEHLVHAVLDDD